ncbi:MAG: hypothetical protein PHU72_06235 [Dethiosulfovibrio sp.]|nr:hypothetical protein [Dethiosulfovibrio sp.]
MYLKWMDNGKGYVWLSKPGLRDFVESRLYQGVICRDVDFVGERNQLVVSLVMEEGSFYLDRLRLAEDLSKTVRSMGMDVLISWKQEEELEKEELSFFERPIFWGGLTSAIYAAFSMGFRKTLLCVVVGASVYGAMSFLHSESGRTLKEDLLNFIKEILD